jgi:hypothetical protein
MIAFKEGESSTVSALNVLGRENFATLLNAFPTVSNFAIDLFSTIGFTSIYLIGVDLGFVDVKHHHSKSSGYYKEDGQETYDFTKSANTSLIVPGNFRPRVNTKHEFKVSRQVIEQVTSAKPKGQEFYNCSDGARINCTLPIRPDELLIVATKQQKMQIVKKLKTIIFSAKELDNYEEMFEKQFSQDLLIEELGAFETLLEKDVASDADIENIINKQKEMLFSSYKNGKSLLFYYLYGTVNYSNAILTKLHHKALSNDLALSKGIEQAKEKWLDSLKEIKNVLFEQEPNDFDNSSFRLMQREIKSLENNCGNCSILIVTDSSDFRASTRFVLEEQISWLKKVEIISRQELSEYRKLPDYVIYHLVNLKSDSLKGKKNTIVMFKSDEVPPANYDGVTYLKISEPRNEAVFESPILLAQVAIISCLSEQKCPLIIPKYIAMDKTELEENANNVPSGNYEAFSNFLYISILFKDDNLHLINLSNNGSRAKKVFGKIKMKHLVWKLMSEADFKFYKQNVYDTVNSKK